MASAKEQLLQFHYLYSGLFKKEENKPPKNWNEAFQRLVESVQAIGIKQKVILFFDELPWLAGKNSGFMAALDYHWNRFFFPYAKCLFNRIRIRRLLDD